MPIAGLQSQGVNGAWVTCHNPACLRSTPVSFTATPFPAVAKARRFVCATCGSRRVNMTLDWRMHRAPGTGRWSRKKPARGVHCRGRFSRVSGSNHRRAGRVKMTPTRLLPPISRTHQLLQNTQDSVTYRLFIIDHNAAFAHQLRKGEMADLFNRNASVVRIKLFQMESVGL